VTKYRHLVSMNNRKQQGGTVITDTNLSIINWSKHKSESRHAYGREHQATTPTTTRTSTQN
jgi:hypothetical protein